MQDLLYSIEKVTKKKVLFITEDKIICSKKDLPINFSYKELKKKIFTNYEGYNIYKIDGQESSALLCIESDKYELTDVIKLLILMISDKVQHTYLEHEEIINLIEGKDQFNNKHNLEIIQQLLPLHIILIDEFKEYEEEVKQILMGTLDCPFVVKYKEKLIAGVKLSEGDIKEECNIFLKNILSDILLECKVVIGGCAESINDIKSLYERSIEGERLHNKYHIPEKLIHTEELYSYMVVDSMDKKMKEELVERIFTNEMLNFLNDEMRRTIEEFFKNNLNITETANRLYIHRNTLIYRIDKIYKITGFDLRNFNNSSIFQLAYLAYKECR